MEAADTLYGVTMQEEGISKLVSVRFNEDFNFVIKTLADCFPNLCQVFTTTVILIIVFSVTLKAQWVNNPALNTKLVIGGSKPINISSVEDLKGGAFLFWEDNKSGFQNEILFVHMDGNGKVTFRADGKKISELNGDKVSPAACINLPNTAVVVWKDFSVSKTGNLFVQKVYGNGNLLWKKNGVQVTPNYPDVSDYSVCSDNKGNVYVAYIAKPDEFGSSYKLKLQKIRADGEIADVDGITIHDSPGRKISTSIIADNYGGAYLFWLENQNNKTILFSSHIDSTGKDVWGKKTSCNFNHHAYSTQLLRADE